MVVTVNQKLVKPRIHHHYLPVAMVAVGTESSTNRLREGSDGIEKSVQEKTHEDDLFLTHRGKRERIGGRERIEERENRRKRERERAKDASEQRKGKEARHRLRFTPSFASFPLLLACHSAPSGTGFNHPSLYHSMSTDVISDL